MAIALVALAAAERAASAQVVINEIEYDEPGTDTGEYVELKNTGPSPASLAGYSLVLVNGASGGAATYATIALPAVNLAAGGYYVVCGSSAVVVPCDLDVSPDTNLVQNGAPDAVALMLAGQPVDRVSYEGAVSGFTEGTAGAVADDGAAAGQGLARFPDGQDSDDNAADFQLRANTPGAANGGGGGGMGGGIGACGDPATALSAVQGSGPASPLAGQTVVIEGVVTGDFQDGSLNGFFVQEEDAQQDGNPATSDGVFIFEGAFSVPVSAGNLVRVRGQVQEFDGTTELSGVTAVLVCPGAPAAPATALAFPVAAVADLERYEGMLVEVAQTMTVTGNFDLGQFGSLDLSAAGRLYTPTALVAPGAAALALQDVHDRNRIVLDDGSSTQAPSPIPYKDGAGTRRVGDTVTGLTGVLDERFGAYRIHPTVAPLFAAGNPRPPAPPATGGRLQVAAFNVLNYFTTLDQGQPVCGPMGGLDCRGANTALELDRQRTKLLNALAAVAADVIGLIEIENNPSAAVQSLADGLNARFGAGTYAFINTGTIGGDAIKVALLYRPARVTPVGSFALLTSAVDPRFIDNKNRPALAQSFAEGGTGARFTVVLNHLKSKGSACDDVGDPDHGDGQGNCNGTRTAAAAALLSWIGRDPTGSGDPDFLLMGDLNAYAREDPITTFKAGGLVSLIESFVGAGASSFQFQGQSGYLDDALATPGLAAQVTGAVEWHIDADEPRVLDYNTEQKGEDLFNAADPFRASDHDPLIVGLDLVAPAAVPALGSPMLGALAGLLLAAGAAATARSRRVHGRRGQRS